MNKNLELSFQQSKLGHAAGEAHTIVSDAYMTDMITYDAWAQVAPIFAEMQSRHYANAAELRSLARGR